MSKVGRVSGTTKEHYTLTEIERALKNKELIYVYAEQGDLEIIHLIIDADEALKIAKPTYVQLQTAELVWKKGYSLVETGKMLGVTPQAVKFNLDLLRIKLKKVVDEWKRLDKEQMTR